MNRYTTPLAKILAAYDALILKYPPLLDKETITTILAEAGRMSENILAPINQMGDQMGAQFEAADCVMMPEGFLTAYQQFCEQGWASAGCPEEYDGQPLPMVMMTALFEIFNAGNAAFTLLPMLNFGTVQLLNTYASDDIKNRYLSELISGKLSATMVLTEADAGSDMVSIKTRATIDENGLCHVVGRKQFITFGEHSLTENIIHLVLVRTSTTSTGLRGLSVVLVPKYCPDGKRNIVHCQSIERKMGIHAAPTATMTYGDDQQGAMGYLIGKAGRGLEYFYAMMTLARFFIAVQSLGISEVSYQKAWHYAKIRKQGFLPGNHQPVSIISHPDVVRMLATMRMHIRAMRAGIYRVALSLDRAKFGEEKIRKFEQGFSELMIPALKAFCSDISLQVTSTAIQVFGGIGYIEETGVEQHYRDARIGSIYEGTNGIQAIEVITRRVVRDQGRLIFALIEKVRNHLHHSKIIPEIHYREALSNAVDQLALTTQRIVKQYKKDAGDVLYSANDYVTLLAIVVCGWQLGRTLKDHDEDRADLCQYRDEMLLQSDYLAAKIMRADSRWVHTKNMKT